MKKRTWIFGGGAGVLTIALFTAYGVIGIGPQGARGQRGIAVASTISGKEAPLIVLHKNPTCACCGEWADHMRANGFRVEVKDAADLNQIKRELKVPLDLSSCHTAVIDGYALEGHVPADAVRKLLDERPKIIGLAVAGMPAGVPGMPGEDLGSYDVVAFEKNGSTQVYARK